MSNENDKIDSDGITWPDLLLIFILKLMPSKKRSGVRTSLIFLCLSLIFCTTALVSSSSYFYDRDISYVVPSKTENASYFTQFEDSPTYLKALAIREITPVTWSGYLTLKLAYGKFLPYLVKEEDIGDLEFKVLELPTHLSMVTNAYIAAIKESGRTTSYETKYTVSSIPAKGYEEGKYNVEPGDQVLSVDGVSITSVKSIDYLTASHEAKELEIIRIGEKMTVTSSLYSIFIQVTTEVKDKLALQETVKLFENNYKGNSAGAAIALELYCHFVSDVIKGRNIAITGSIDSDGNIGAIGGASAKTMLAKDAGAEIMFVPFDSYLANNYTDSNRINKLMKSKMKIVPVDTLHEVIEYLKVH